MLRKKTIGILILIVAWELLTYATCEYFFPTKIYKKVYRRQRGSVMDWVDYFNDDLFQALNIVGLALLLIYIGYNLIKNRERVPSK